MTARAELGDPGPIFGAIFLRPLLDEFVTEIGGWITTVTTRARETGLEMNVLNQILEIHVSQGFRVVLGESEKRSSGV